jgi:hypothetical protein
MNVQFESMGGMHQITELEPNLQAATSVEDHDTEGEIIQSDNSAPQQLESLREGSKVSSLELYLNYHQRKIGDNHQNDMYQKMVQVQKDT